MPYASNTEGTYLSRGLCDSIKSLTEQRLAFDTKMGERARASAKLLSSAADSGMSKEGRVTFMKLRGDQLLHLAEMARYDGGVSIAECEGLAAQALEAYLAAQQEASAKDINTTNKTISSSGTRSSNDSSGNSGALPALHPLRVELALRISSVLLHLLDRPVEAWEVGYPTYLAAAEHPTRLGARGLAITQALRDHLALIDIQGEEVEQPHEDIRNSERDGTAHGSAKDGQAVGEGVEGEWGFLRMSALGVPTAPAAGIGRTACDRLRVLAQVKQARACMEAVTANDRVLLGTMESADVVQSALKQIFLAYTKKFVIPAQVSVDRKGHERARGRKTTPHRSPRKGAFLSWPGFEAACQDFNIIPTATVKPSVATTAATAHHRALAQHNHRQQHQPPNTSLDYQPAPGTSLASSASKTDSRPGSPTGMMLSVETTTSGLLSGVQACIAFLSAYTHGSVVASFPNDNGNGGFSGDGAKRIPYGLSRGGSGLEDGGASGVEDVSAYWRGIERVMLSGSVSLDAGSCAQGLNFRQFVDALARCGLVGFSSKGVGGTAHEKQLVSAAERAQAIFKTQMRLLDKQHVAAKLQKLAHLPPADQEKGPTIGVEGRVERSTHGSHGRTAGDGNGTKKANATARGSTQRGTRRDGGKKAATAADPKPAHALAPIQTTTPRGSKR